MPSTTEGLRRRSTSQRLPDRERDPERRASQAAMPLAAHAGDRNPFDVDAVLRHDARLETALRAEPDDVAPPARSSSATASAGNTCPPVPPAMIMIGAALMRPFRGFSSARVTSWWIRAQQPRRTIVMSTLERP
jgi:hypothetical protein